MICRRLGLVISGKHHPNSPPLNMVVSTDSVHPGDPIISAPYRLSSQNLICELCAPLWGSCRNEQHHSSHMLVPWRRSCCRGRSSSTSTGRQQHACGPSCVKGGVFFFFLGGLRRVDWVFPGLGCVLKVKRAMMLWVWGMMEQEEA